jgi:hypothetical protein
VLHVPNLDFFEVIDFLSAFAQLVQRLLVLVL